MNLQPEVIAEEFDHRQHDSMEFQDTDRITRGVYASSKMDDYQNTRQSAASKQGQLYPSNPFYIKEDVITINTRDQSKMGQATGTLFQQTPSISQNEPGTTLQGTMQPDQASNSSGKVIKQFRNQTLGEQFKQAPLSALKAQTIQAQNENSLDVKAVYQNRQIERVVSNQKQLTIQTQRPKRMKKRYYNGFGKVPKSYQSSLVRQDYSARSALPKSSQSSTRNAFHKSQAEQYQRPYPGYAFNFPKETIEQDIEHATIQRPQTQGFQRSNAQNVNTPPFQRIQTTGNFLDDKRLITVNLKGDGAYIGLNSPINELKSLVEPQKRNDSNLQFTLDQYRWAQKQGIEKKSIHEGNSLGLKIEKGVSSKHRVATAVTKKSKTTAASNFLKSDDDFVQEAAITHMIHRADNMPKIQVKLVDDPENDQYTNTYNIDLISRQELSDTIIPAAGTQSNVGSIEGLRSVHATRNASKNIYSERDPGPMSPIGKYLMGQQERLPSAYAGGAGTKHNNLAQAQGLAAYEREKTARLKKNILQNKNPVRSAHFRKQQQLQQQYQNKIYENGEEERFYDYLDQPYQQQRQSSQRVLRQNFTEKDCQNAPTPSDFNADLDVRRNRRPYEYIPLQDEVRDNECLMSPGNMYNERTNPQMAKLFNSVQGHIQESQTQRHNMKQDVTRVFGMIKKTKHQYIKTLLEGEELGHCKGIKKRMNPSTKYQILAKIRYQKQQEENMKELILERKDKRDKEKMEAKQQRVQDRLQMMDILKENGGIMPIKPLRQQRRRNLSEAVSKLELNNDIKSEKKELYEDADKEKQLPKVDLASSEGSGDSELADINDENLDKLCAGDVDSKPQNLSIDKSVSFPKKTIFRPTQILQTATKRVKSLIDELGFKNVSPEQIKGLENSFVQQLTNGHHAYNSAMVKIIKYMQNPDFEKFKDAQQKNAGQTSKKKNKTKIFESCEELGLMNKYEFKTFILSLGEEQQNQLRHLRIKRPALLEHLQSRYTPVIGERILLFLENMQPIIMANDYCECIKEFLNAGPEMHKKLLFSCLSLTNVGRICEHDLFSIFENFKQRDSFVFYKELISQKDVPRDFKDAIDDSDKIFFEAFAPDIKKITHSLILRKKLLSVEDQDLHSEIVDDFKKSHHQTEESFEDELVNQIDYIIGIVLKKGGHQYQEGIIKILIEEQSLKLVKKKLVDMCYEQKIIQKHTRKAVELDSSNMDPRKLQEQQAQSINFSNIAKEPTNIIPCLGSGTVTRTGKKTTQCSYLTFEDFNKLMTFRKGQLSSIIGDLVDHLTSGLLQVHSIEEHLGHIRNIPVDSPQVAVERQGLVTLGLDEFIQERNIAIYGKAVGQVPLNIAAKKNKSPQKKRTEGGSHTITSPFTCHNQFIGEDFQGKFLIPKTIMTKKTEKLKSKNSVMDAGDHPERASLLDIMSEQTQGHDGQNEVNMVVKEKVEGLIAFRGTFGDPNFFKLFRAFYALCNVPEESQNNPLVIHMNRSSCIRYFEKVFGHDNEEVAIRFNELFVEPEGQPKMYNIDIFRFYHVMQTIYVQKDKSDITFIKLAFRFLDYDNNGSIGSVDILNLKKSFDQKDIDQNAQLFYKESVLQKFSSNMSKLKDAMNTQCASATNQSEKQKGGVRTIMTNISRGLDALPSSTAVKRDDNESKKIQQSQQDDENQSDEESPENQPDDDIAKDSLNEESKTSAQSRKQAFLKVDETRDYCKDPWNRFKMEVHYLRDYFVNEVIVSKVKTQEGRNINQTFFNLKNYEMFFLPTLETKFGMETPTIIHFLKSKLFYPNQELVKNKSSTKKCYETNDPNVSKELVQMQEMLDQLSTSAKTIYAD